MITASSHSSRSGPVPLDLALGEERVPPGELSAIEEMLRIHTRVQDRTDPPGGAPRGQHPKQHGCLMAEFVVDPELPADLRHGILRESRVHRAIVRFSNARQKHDELPDAHGVALKVFGVPGERLLPDASHTQDFVLIDHPVFFMSTVEHGLAMMREFERLLTGGVFGRARTIARGLLSQQRSFQILRAMASKRIANPLMTRYWSTTPIRLGPWAVKLSIRPGSRMPVIRSHGRDRLREALVRVVEQEGATLEFLIQRQLHPVSTPVEDPTVEWDEAVAPFLRVATLRVPRQRCDAVRELALAERLSFSPWNGIEDHRPLGGINRARRSLYLALAARRRARNRTPQGEPTDDEVAGWWAAATA